MNPNLVALRRIQIADTTGAYVKQPATVGPSVGVDS